MPFPESKRVLYKHNPLEQVICQLKFPVILRIESELPAGFQEQIRSLYPIFSEPQALSAGPEFPEEIMKVVGSLMPIRPTRVYEFAAVDGNWKLTLSRDFIALVCLRYERWERFVEHLRGPAFCVLRFTCRVARGTPREAEVVTIREGVTLPTILDIRFLFALRYTSQIDMLWKSM